MSFNTSVKNYFGQDVTIPALIGNVTFVLGANGSGKSSLMQRLYSKNVHKSKRIAAHRQNWLPSNTSNFSASQKVLRENAMNVQDSQDAARWRDDGAANRVLIILYDVINSENIRSRNIAKLVTENKLQEASKLSEELGPLDTINDILLSSNMPIHLSFGNNDAIMAKKLSGAEYSVAELSDGERNALLIAGSVLTAPAGSLILVDEPERHLHPSISFPLLSQLFSKRKDCAFVVSTHELSLPLNRPDSQVVLVRGCSFSGAVSNAWDVDILNSPHDISESLRADVMGGRRKILFIEGDENSIDKALYAILFPGVHVVAKSSCRDVKSHVSGIRNASELHWISAFGVIDRDQLDQNSVDNLALSGVYAINCYSVESIYYHPDVQRYALENLAKATGINVISKLADAENASISSILPHIDRLSARMTERVVRDQLMINAPNWKDIAAGGNINVQIDVPGVHKQERERLNDMILRKDIKSIIQRYPIRETPLIDKVVNSLGFADRAQYESTVRKRVSDDLVVRNFVLSLFGNLSRDIA